MTVRSRNDLIYLGNILGNRELGIFVFGCREDEEIMLANGNPFRVSTSVVDRNFMERWSQRAVIDPQLVQMGFKCLATDLFEAPPRVMAYLRSVVKVLWCSMTYCAS